MKEEHEQFDSLGKVLNYLEAKGYTVSRRTLFRHRKVGKLTADKGGSFSEKNILKYAADFLKLKSDESKLGDAQKEKILSDARRSKAMAKLAEEKAKRESGKYIHKKEFARHLAVRAMLLKQDLTNFAYTAAPEICATVNGEHDLVPDLVELMLRKYEKFLGRYAANPEIK